MRPIKLPATVKNYQLEKNLGVGNFGAVYRAIDGKSKQFVALKIIPKVKIREQPKLAELIATEIKVLRDCKSEHVIKLIDNFENESEIFIVMEYCNEGDFEKYMENKKVLSEQEALTFLKQLLNGFKGLHEINVIHRDFKIANLLMHDGKLKIGDLGFAKQTKTLAATCLGTTLYMAPEVLQNSKYTNKVDIWSLAIVYYQMLFGHDKYPFYASNDLGLLKKIKAGIVNYQVNGIHISEQSIDLLSRMLKANPEERIEWSEVYDHPLIRPPAPIGNQKMGMSMIRSIAGFEMMGNSLSNDKWNENMGFYKEIEGKKQNIDKYDLNDKQAKGNPNGNMFDVKKPDLYFDKAVGNYFEFIFEEEVQKDFEKDMFIVKQKESINNIAKRLSQVYLHFRNVNCVYARVLEGLQLNPSQNLNVLFPQYLLMKKIYLENNKLIDSIKSRRNIFKLTEDIELIEGALKHELLQKVLGSLQGETEILGFSYAVLKEDMSEAIKKMKELDKSLSKFINDEDGKQFNERFREDVYNLALSINDEFNAIKDKGSEFARKKLTLAIEVFNCLCPESVFPYDVNNPQNNFDFKKYEEALERKSISGLTQDLQQTAGFVMDKLSG